MHTREQLKRSDETRHDPVLPLSVLDYDVGPDTLAALMEISLAIPSDIVKQTHSFRDMMLLAQLNLVFASSTKHTLIDIRDDGWRPENMSGGPIHITLHGTARTQSIATRADRIHAAQAPSVHIAPSQVVYSRRRRCQRCTECIGWPSIDAIERAAHLDQCKSLDDCLCRWLTLLKNQYDSFLEDGTSIDRVLMHFPTI